MDTFTPIDRETWPRRELFELYTEYWTTTTFAVSVKLNAEKLVKYQKSRGQKLVPALLYAFSSEISKDMAFTVALINGVVGHWDKMHPMYPVLNENGTFTFHTTPLTEDFDTFYKNYLQEKIDSEGKIGAFSTEMPPNAFIISIMPYFRFEAFSFAMKNPKNYYAPIVSIGKYDENYVLPVAATVNHAVCDGYHISELFRRVQYKFDHPEEWI